jgi:hypothetical protein
MTIYRQNRDAHLGENRPLSKLNKQSSDSVDHPAHYTAYTGLEIIELVEQMNFNRGNAVKYIARAGLKSKDTEIEDLKKAVWYINREIRRLESG